MTMTDEKASAITETCDSIPDIDACLSNLYDRLIENEQALPTVKALLLNLIIYAPDEAHAEAAMEHVSRVLPLVPCRAIIAEITSTWPSNGASVSVMCGISERGDRRLCGEVINVHAVKGTITGAVMPLLIADVPVCLWVLGDVPPDSDDFADLLRASSYVIVDSRKFSDMSRGFKAIDQMRSSNGINRTVQDLAWVSLHSWREATAEHFDPPSVRKYLSHIESLNISYSGSSLPPYPESPPLLFAAWFAERTGLSLHRVFHSRDEGFVLNVSQDAGAAIRLVPGESHRAPGELTQVTISCRSDSETAVFSTERVSDAELVLAEECKEVCVPPKKVSVAPEDAAALVVQALEFRGRDWVYEDALANALRIIARIELADEHASSLRL